jgi:hypothetical protein
MATHLPLQTHTFANTLTAPAATSNTEKRVICENKALFVYTIATINTTAVVGLRVSMDGTNWGTAPGVADVSHTTNGTYALQFTGCAPYVALLFVSETGGTAAVITIQGAYVD